MKKLFCILVIAMALFSCGNSKKQSEELTNESFGKEVLSFNGIKLNSPKDSVLSAIKANSSFGSPYSSTNEVRVDVTIIAPHYETDEKINIQGNCIVELFKGKTNKITFRDDTGNSTYFSSLCKLYFSKYGKYISDDEDGKKGFNETKCIWEGNNQRITLKRQYWIPVDFDDDLNRMGPKYQHIEIIYEDLIVEKILKAKADSIHNIIIEQEKQRKQKEQDSLNNIMKNQTI